MRDIMALSETIGGRGSQDKQIKETQALYRAISREDYGRKERGLTWVDSENKVGIMRYRKKEIKK
jgi:hypothetical protein